ncbi:hypothetical protein [Achromobacter marplatensis]|uniref:hypothetical protein n=1 Tax=Achromobacter marplatensis TaxID=470868 RepID=UPI000277F9F1|nr:hypothetical protein [Achromobacter marplatensis]EJO27534.1 hypothetical protein QWC_31331 [Achromobacter marplatensis]
MLDPSLFVSDSVQKKEVELPDGKKHTLYFKEYSGAAFTRYALVARSSDIQERSTAAPILIYSSMCNPDGTPALSFERACMLKPEVMQAIFATVLEVNGVKKPGEESDEKNA